MSRKESNVSSVSALTGAGTCAVEGVALAPVLGVKTCVFSYKNAYMHYKSKHRGHLNVGRKILFATLGFCAAPFVVAENLIEGMFVAPGKGLKTGYNEGLTRGFFLAPYSILKSKSYTEKKTVVNHSHPQHQRLGNSKNSNPPVLQPSNKVAFFGERYVQSNVPNLDKPAPNLSRKPNC